MGTIISFIFSCSNKLQNMLCFCKTILEKVSFDKNLFKKELKKSTRLIDKKERMVLKIWCLTSFANYRDIILEVFENTI